MTVPRIIFVDGLPGSGKSTTAQRLSLHLRRQGHAARWVFEHETPHPVFEESAMRALREQHPDADPGLFSQALDNYRKLAQHLVAHPEEIMVLEGALFQAAAGTQLLLERPDDAIDAFLAATLAALSPLVPTLIYLRPKDPATALEQTAQNRGEWFPQFVVAHLAATPRGQRMQVSTWTDARAVLSGHQQGYDRLFGRFAGPRLEADPQNTDWNTLNLEITQFLGLPPMQEPAGDPRWAQHVGRYRAEGSDDVWEFVLTENGLELKGPPSARLWARPEGGFEIEGLAVEITFVSTGPAPSTRVDCSTRLASLPLHWHRI